MAKVWGHRGASGYAPENTMEAFALAVEMGAYGIELDVQMSADGKLVVCHDERIDRTSNGSGAIAALSYEKLAQYNYHAGFSAETFYRLPLLEEVLELLKPTALHLNIELKCDSLVRYEGMEVDVYKRQVYVSVLMSGTLSLLEYFFPMSAPLTNEPVLELIFAIVLPSFGSAILFNMNASGGGTDIIAMVLRKYTSFNIGSALFLVDLCITVAACFVFDAQTGLFSFCGLMAKSLVIDGVIENINLCKYFTIICNEPEPICEYIHKELHRGCLLYTSLLRWAKKMPN